MLDDYPIDLLESLGALVGSEVRLGIVEITPTFDGKSNQGMRRFLSFEAYFQGGAARSASLS